MTMTHKIFDLEIVGCYTLVKTAIVMVLCLSDAEVRCSILSRCMLSNSVILLRHRSSACTLVHVWRYQVILFSLCINTSVVALRNQSSRFLCISLLPNAHA